MITLRTGRTYLCTELTSGPLLNLIISYLVILSLLREGRKAILLYGSHSVALVTVQVCPCDAVIISGTCVVNEAMLTGESTPHLKEAISNVEPDSVFSVIQHKSNMLFGGTTVIQHSYDKTFRTKPHDGGCVAYVLRTGFDTNQGRLMRTILFATEHVTANNKESLLFILFLLVFAVAASGYVLVKGLENETRSRYKLLLNCSLIITSVVPPELPLELSLAVNTSLLALRKFNIFCTEPFRVIFAGAVRICCFDKTGTLTSDDIIFRGVSNIHSRQQSPAAEHEEYPIVLPADLKSGPLHVLAGCQSLARFENQLIGDPLEISAFKAIGWSFKNDSVCSRTGKSTIRVLSRYPFNSLLKRMSTIVVLDELDSRNTILTSKGAPEVMKPLFRQETLPHDYDSWYKHFSLQGGRVLALGYKQLRSEHTSVDALRASPRETVERNLEFAGFAVFECPIKPHTRSAVQKLKRSSHKVVIITGDNVLTACHVASELGIIHKQALLLSLTPENNLQWTSLDESVVIPADKDLSKLHNFHLCTSGDTFERMLHDGGLRSLIPDVRVFARMSPEQKELVLTTLKGMNYTTLMCGDGTNDVGALKQAHVGVALLATAEKQSAAQPVTSSPPSYSRSGRRSTASQTSDATSTSPASPLERYRQQLAELDTDSTPLVQLGDASIASPFTCKASSVLPVTQIIRQGRCTLVATLQMYKILAMNCLISAYSLSVLYIDGVKLGDYQAMIIGILLAFCFLFVSQIYLAWLTFSSDITVTTARRAFKATSFKQSFSSLHVRFRYFAVCNTFWLFGIHSRYSSRLCTGII